MTTTATLSEAPTRYYILRGLLMVPPGVVLAAAGLFNLPPIGAEEVPNHALWFLPLLVAGAIALYLVNRYYVTTFGRVEPLPATKVRVAVWTVLATAGLCVGILVDSQSDLPISLYGLLFAVLMLLYYRAVVGLAAHHWVILGGLAVFSLVPIWGAFDDKVSVAMVAIGIATVLTGWYDHRELMATFRAGAVADA